MRSKTAGTIFFLLSGIEGAGAVALLLSIPPDPRRAVFAGFSAARLVLLALAVLGSAAFLALAFSWWRGRRFSQLENATRRWGSTREHRLVLTLAPLAAGILTGFAANALMDGRFPAWQAAAYRLAPLLVWASLVCFQLGLLFALAFSGSSRLADLKNLHGTAKAALITAAALIGGWVALAQTGLGFTVRSGDWIQGPNPPVLFSQVFLVVALLVLLAGAVPQFKNHQRVDFLLGGCIWVLGVIVWELTPYNASFFATRPFPPNFETYPYSDARDLIVTGQTLLIGEGYDGHALVLRPLQVLMLTIYHVIAGQNYDRVVAVQVLVLALIPMSVYWIGRKIHSRMAGIAAALLLILRERNSLLISGMVPGGNTHVKLFMTELPTILGMVILIVVLLRWFEKPNSHHLAPLAAGGVIGAMVLIRSQALILLPALAALMVFWVLRRPRLWLPAVLSLGLGAALFLAPWVARNYRLAGFFVLENAPSLHLGYEARYYAGVDTTPLPGEAGNEYNARMTGIILDYSIRHPLEVLRFASVHFFHNEISTSLVFPVQPDFSGLVEYTKDNILWEGGKFRPQAPLDAAFLILNIAIVGFGVGSAFKRGHGLVLVPLLVRFGYNLSLALARRSGGRYFTPGDWVGLLLYGLGLAELLLWAAALLGGSRSGDGFLAGDSEMARPDASPHKPPSLPAWLACGAVILAAGCLIPAAEWLVPPRYENLTPPQVVTMLETRPSEAGSDDRLALLQDFAARPDAGAKWGRGLYPRYFQAGEGVRSYEALLDVQRLRFEVIGPQPGEVILQGAALPRYFPDASDVAVFGCQAQGYLDALLVVVLDANGDHYYWRDPLPPVWECPLS